MLPQPRGLWTVTLKRIAPHRYVATAATNNQTWYHKRRFFCDLATGQITYRGLVPRKGNHDA